MTSAMHAIAGRSAGRKRTPPCVGSIERKIYLLTMTPGEEEEITDIVITPETFRCNHCRLVVSSRLDWEDHLPACLRQREKLRRLGLIV